MSTEDATMSVPDATPGPSRGNQRFAGVFWITVFVLIVAGNLLGLYAFASHYVGTGWPGVLGALTLAALYIVLCLENGILWIIRVAFGLAGVAMAGAFAAWGWFEAGWIGAVVGLVFGVALFLGVVFVGWPLLLFALMALIWLILYVLSVGPEDVEETGTAMKPKRTERDQSANELLPVPSCRPLHRPIAIIAITLALWVRYGWPALSHASDWSELCMLTLLPSGFIGLVGRHLPTLLLQRFDRPDLPESSAAESSWANSAGSG